jgi:hypothetical protein
MEQTLKDNAFINSQAACAMIEALGMAADNQQRAVCGESPCWVLGDFVCLIDKYGISHNQVVSTLQRN